MDPPDTLRDGRYAVIRVLGEGGQATTFEAVDKQAGRAVAIKRFRVRGAASWKEVELAEREARVLASIDHPALPRYVDHFEEGGELFLVMEKIEGESLAALRQQGAPFGERDARSLLREAAAVLEYLHGRSPPIIHRDLKPSNVLRRPDGSFAFIDFGAVRDKMKPGGGSTVVGTFGYMAPEQFQGRALPASDVYGVATTALAMLTGQEPEDLPHRGLAIDVGAALRDFRVSPALVTLLGQMLEPDPDHRLATLGPSLATLEREGREARDEEQGDRRRERGERRREREGGRGERREERRRDKQDRREERWRQADERHAGATGSGAAGVLGGLVFAVVVMALSLAELAVTLMLRVAVPVLLTLLSVIFGRGMREAAKRVGESGKTAAGAIARVRAGVRGRDRVRVAEDGDGPRVRVDAVDPAEAAEDDQAAVEAAAAAEEKRRR
jgi:hypothetical protein